MIRMPDFSHMSLSPKPVSPTSLWAFEGRFQICFKTKVVAQVLHSKAQGFLCLCLLKSPIDAGNQEDITWRREGTWSSWKRFYKSDDPLTLSGFDSMRKFTW